MKIVHCVKVSVFEYSDSENLEKVEEKLKSLFPFEITKFLTKKRASEFNDKQLYTFEVRLENNGIINKFMKHFNDKLSPAQRDFIKSEKEKRLDEHHHLFIRLDKEKLLNDEYAITDSGNCFHMRISIASFPKKRESALKVIDQIFS